MYWVECDKAGIFEFLAPIITPQKMKDEWLTLRV